MALIIIAYMLFIGGESLNLEKGKNSISKTIANLFLFIIIILVLILLNRTENSVFHGYYKTLADFYIFGFMLELLFDVFCMSLV